MKARARFRLLLLAALSALASATGCVSQHKVQVEKIAVEPIHIEVDVNLRDAPPDPKRRR